MRSTVKIIALFSVLTLVLCGCGKSTKAQELSDNIDAYETIAEIAIKDFQDEEHKNELDEGTRWVVMLSEFSKYDNLKDEIDISEKSFSYLWIEEENVVFWNDETKVLGLVYSSNPKDYINSLKKWYQDMEYERINENWYVVGSWEHN